MQCGKTAPPLAMVNGIYICQFPESGSVVTSSLLEEGWAKDEYFYYSGDGSIEGLPNTGWGGGGTIWAAGSTGHESSKPGLLIERFYVGKEDQYRRNETNQTVQPSNEAKHY